MNLISQETWLRLAGERPLGEALWARRALPETSERLFAALDANGQRHLLILLQKDEGEIQDKWSRGISAITRDLVIARQGAGRYIDIVCHDSAGHKAFDLIGGEIADRLASKREPASESVSRVLTKWRRFWERQPSQILSKEEQLGLFAELWFLGVWLLPKVGIAEAIHRWRGPLGSRHDFEWTECSIEVKATSLTRGIVHRIHGIEQLVKPDTGKLLFFSLKLREEAGASNSLTSLITMCREQAEVDDEILSHFEAKLAQAGYSPAYEEDYANFRLRIVEEGLFIVNERFPSITPDKFVTTTPPSGVEYIEYDINLSGFSDLCIARTPGDTDNLF